MQSRLRINDRWVGEGQPTYFIAEIGSNFDGSLSKAKELVKIAKASGADAVKYQSFTAASLVSAHSFDRLKIGYQANWSESTSAVYEKAEFPLAWHAEVFECARSEGIDFLTSVWNTEALEHLERLGAPAYKIGSGDITWFDFLKKVATTGKPLLLSTGASSLGDVERALAAISETGNDQVLLMQCVTNYPSQHRNANLRVLETYRSAFGVPVGYSDHSSGDVVALGAVAMGATAIEKHFTTDRSLPGPDHPHSMEPDEFAAMVKRVRQLESALGTSVKQITDEEADSAIIMRRSVHSARTIAANETITADMITMLRPAVGLQPADSAALIGRKAKRNIAEFEAIRWEDVQ